MTAILSCIIFLIAFHLNAEIIKEIGIKAGFTDNLLASVESLRKGNPEKEMLGAISGGLGYKQQYGKRNYFYSLYRGMYDYRKKFEDQISFNHNVFLQFNNNFSKTTTFNVTGNLGYSNYFNRPLLTNAVSSTSLFFRQYLKKNLISESTYKMSTIRFLNTKVGSKNDSLNDTYKLNNSLGNNFRLKLKYWLTPHFRLSIQENIILTNFSVTNSPFLNIQSGLLSSENRFDIYSGATISTTVFLTNNFMFDIGYLRENNRSNGKYYRYTSNIILLDIVWMPHSNHQILLENQLKFYDFYNRIFDTRFTNTKKDSRYYLTITYDHYILDKLKLSTKYSVISNNSNDGIDYAVLTSNSYTSFNRSDISTQLKLTF